MSESLQPRPHLIDTRRLYPLDLVHRHERRIRRAFAQTAMVQQGEARVPRKVVGTQRRLDGCDGRIRGHRAAETVDS